MHQPMVADSRLLLSGQIRMTESSTWNLWELKHPSILRLIYWVNWIPAALSFLQSRSAFAVAQPGRRLSRLRSWVGRRDRSPETSAGVRSRRRARPAAGLGDRPR